MPKNRPVSNTKKIAFLALIASALAMGFSVGQRSPQAEAAGRLTPTPQSRPRTAQLNPQVRYRRVQLGSRVRQILDRIELSALDGETGSRMPASTERLPNGLSFLATDLVITMSFGVLTPNSDEVACTASPATVLLAAAPEPKGGRQ